MSERKQISRLRSIVAKTKQVNATSDTPSTLSILAKMQANLRDSKLDSASKKAIEMELAAKVRDIQRMERVTENQKARQAKEAAAQTAKLECRIRRAQKSATAKTSRAISLAKQKEKGKRTRDRIRKLSLEGMEVTAIARKLGLSEGHVVKMRAEEGVSHARQMVTWVAIADLNKKGLNDSEIAHELGMARSHVCKVRNRLGIPAVKRKRSAGCHD